MITIEMLAADAALAGLTDEQKNAIALMSKNDEEVVIGNRFREVYNRLDESIAKETGIARNGDERPTTTWSVPQGNSLQRLTA